MFQILFLTARSVAVSGHVTETDIVARISTWEHGDCGVHPAYQYNITDSVLVNIVKLYSSFKSHGIRNEHLFKFTTLLSNTPSIIIWRWYYQEEDNFLMT